MTREWRDHVLEEINGQSKVNRRYYELCVLHKLQRALRCKEVWVPGSHAYRNPSDNLPADWTNQEHRLAHYPKLGKPLEVDHFIDTLGRRLTAALQRFNDQLPQLTHVRIHVPDSRHPLRGAFALDKLPRQQEPSNLRAIKDGIQRVVNASGQYGYEEVLYARKRYLLTDALRNAGISWRLNMTT